MKRSRIQLIALLCFAGSLALAEPEFLPEAPEAGASALVEAYLPLLAHREYEQAIHLNDLRGMREYFLHRRLAELKIKNPELTEADLKEMSAQIQVNDLNPLRLRDLLLNVFKEGNFDGMTWSIQGYAPASLVTDAYVVRIQIHSKEGLERPLLLGIKKLGTQWMVAPEIIEQIAAPPPSVTASTEQPAPTEVKRMVDTFWSHWKQGELNDVHALLGAEYRKRVPLLPFLQQAQEIMYDQGIPLSWKVVHCRKMGPSTLGLGVDVQGSKNKTQTIMIFRKMGESWVLEDSQFRPVPTKNEPEKPATPVPPPSSRFRSDFQTDLQSPYLSTPAPASGILSPASPVKGGVDSPALE